MMLIPRPKPPVSVERESSSRAKRSNMRSRIFSGMPGPESSIINSTTDLPSLMIWCSCTITGEPAGVYRMMFCVIFARTCSQPSGSPVTVTDSIEDSIGRGEIAIRSSKLVETITLSGTATCTDWASPRLSSSNKLVTRRSRRLASESIRSKARRSDSVALDCAKRISP